MILIIMGVSGCGKTTFAEALHEKLGWPVVEADDHHSSDNKAKMGQGIPLTDEDRFPWLLSLASVISGWRLAGQNGILTCSALRKIYRDILVSGRLGAETGKDTGVMFVHLQGPQEVISTRLGQRKGHFMPGTLLLSQYQSLEPPDPSLEHVLELSVQDSVSDNVQSVCRTLHTQAT